jgi:hypothetical protein
MSELHRVGVNLSQIARHANATGDMLALAELRASWLGRFAWFRRKQDVPGRPYAVAMETVRLAPNAQVSLYP